MQTPTEVHVNDLLHLIGELYVETRILRQQLDALTPTPAPPAEEGPVNLGKPHD